MWSEVIQNGYYGDKQIDEVSGTIGNAVDEPRIAWPLQALPKYLSDTEEVIAGGVSNADVSTVNNESTKDEQLEQSEASKRTVIIIGAGASGIAAARKLYEEGVQSIVILEARNRIGGRVCCSTMTQNLRTTASQEDDTIDEHVTVNINLGANWIHGLNAEINPLFKVAKNLGFRLHPTSSDDDPGDDVIVFDRYRDVVGEINKDEPYYPQVSADDLAAAVERYEWMKLYVEDEAASRSSESSSSLSGETKKKVKVESVKYESNSVAMHPEQVSVIQIFHEAFQKSLEEKNLGPCTSRVRRLIEWFLDRVAIDLAADLNVASHWTYVEGESDGEYGEALMQTGSYMQILEHLLSEYPLDVRLNRIVKRVVVEQNQNNSRPSVVVECLDGERYEADLCLITVPVAVLKNDLIEFSPARPSVVERLRMRYEMGLMNLIWLWFPNIFWHPNCNFIGVARDSGMGNSTENVHWTLPRFSTFLAPPLLDAHGKRQAILMCQVVGEFAVDIESMSDSEVAALATAELRELFGTNIVPDPIGCQRSRWKDDAYAGGSWSYHAKRDIMLSSENSLTRRNRRRQHRYSGSSFSKNLSQIVLNGHEVPSTQVPKGLEQGYHSEEDYLSSRCSVASDLSALDVDGASNDIHQDDGMQSWIDQLIRYAGEAMNIDQRGTVHGAYLSGEEAANRIVHFLRNDQDHIAHN